MDVPVAANVLGTMGAVCWSIQLLPQIILNYRRHHATGLQPAMMLWWATAGVPLGAYNIAQSLPPALQLQPQLLTFLSLLTWTQCLYYQRRWPAPRCLAVAAPVAAAMAAAQTGLVYALRAAVARGLRWPLALVAAVAAACLAAGVLRHYWDIWRWRTVRGISFLFVGIDAAGDVFSLVAVLFQPELDVLALVAYAVELVLWLGVFACGGYYNLWPWLVARRRARKGRDKGRGSVAADEDDTAAAAARTDECGDHAVRHDAALPVQEAAGSSAVELHDLPSSTSVFRTPSREVALARSGTGGSRRSRNECE